MQSVIRCVIYGPLFFVIGGWLIAVLSFRHDDTTTTMRQIVSWQISVSYDAAKTDAAFGELNFDELDIVELMVQIEETFFVSISDEEFTSLGGENG